MLTMDKGISGKHYIILLHLIAKYMDAIGPNHAM